MSSDLLEASLDRLFSDRCGPEVRQRAEDEGFAAELWGQLEEAGFTQLSVAESAGGSGGSLGDAAVLCRVAGRHAVPLPLAEATLLGGFLVERAGMTLPIGPLGIALPHRGDHLELIADRSGWRLSGQLGRVPFGGRCSYIVAVAALEDREYVALLPTALAAVKPGRNLAGEARDALDFTDAELSAEQVCEVPLGTAAELELRGALSRALLIAGAVEAVSAMTIGYAEERKQFGRPIATFQAVANRLVLLASEAELAGIAAGVAAERFEAAGTAAAYEVAVAKASASRSASVVAAHAHQVHAAIGMTRDYPLHHFTRRLWCWRQEWGAEGRWNRELGGLVASAGADCLWPRITAQP